MRTADALWKEWVNRIESIHKENEQKMRQLEEEVLTERTHHVKMQYQQQIEDERREKERLEREKSEMENRLMDEKQAERDTLKAELASLKVSCRTPDHLRPC